MLAKIGSSFEINKPSYLERKPSPTVEPKEASNGKQAEQPIVATTAPIEPKNLDINPSFIITPDFYVYRRSINSVLKYGVNKNYLPEIALTIGQSSN